MACAERGVVVDYPDTCDQVVLDDSGPNGRRIGPHTVAYHPCTLAWDAREAVEGVHHLADSDTLAEAARCNRVALRQAGVDSHFPHPLVLIFSHSFPRARVKLPWPFFNNRLWSLRLR